MVLCRKADKDMVVGGYRISKGTPINIPNFVVHMADRNFEQPYRFWPGRWSQTDSTEGPDKGVFA